MSSKRKLVWVATDVNGLPYATGEMVDAFHAAYDAAGFNPISRGIDSALELLPDALLVSEGDREELAALIDPAAYDPANATDRFTEFDREQARERADVFLKVGYRKVTALDRETLVEVLAEALAPMPWTFLTEDGREPSRIEARALISRAEGTV